MKSSAIVGTVGLVLLQPKVTAAGRMQISFALNIVIIIIVICVMA